jgi:hypothetical protein
MHYFCTVCAILGAHMKLQSTTIIHEANNISLANLNDQDISDRMDFLGENISSDWFDGKVSIYYKTIASEAIKRMLFKHPWQPS